MTRNASPVCADSSAPAPPRGTDDSRDTDATILCPYNLAELAPAILADARCTHPTLWMDVRGSRSDAYGDPGRTADSFNLRHDPEPPHAVSMSLWPQNPDESRRFTASCALAIGISGAGWLTLCSRSTS